MLSKILKLSLVIVVFGQIALFAGVEWKTDWQKELKAAAEANKPVIIDFYTDWCPHCKRMDKTTFKEESVLKYLADENYVMIKVNPEKDKAAEDKFKVYSYPTFVMFDGKGNEVDRMLGYYDGEKFVNALNGLKKGIGTLDDLRNRYQKTKGNATKENFELIDAIISKLVARADYPEALEMADETVRLDKDNKKDKAAGALHMKGYIYYKWKKYQKSVDELTAIHKIYPKSEQAAEGLASAAYYSQKMNKPEVTRDILQQFIELFPKHDYAQKAKEELDKINKHLAEKK
jgi:thioredoxin-related protein